MCIELMAVENYATTINLQSSFIASQTGTIGAQSSDDDFAMEGLKSLRRALVEALERKRLLGQYAVF